MHSRWPALVAGWLLLLGVAAAAPNGTALHSEAPLKVPVTPVTPVTPDAPAVASVNPAETISEEDERPASVEQVPPPAPLITESAHKGYRMPGLYGMGSQPFYLERDPVTGAVDFSHPAQPQADSNHRYSSKVSEPNSPLQDQEYDYEEVAIDEEASPIDRKDTLGSNRPNDIKPYQQDFTPYYQSNNYREKIPAKEKFPLISSSYANTKVQGMGIVKQEPQKPITVSTPPPSYFTFKPSTPTTTTEPILDFWPQKASSTVASPPPLSENYDYYEESPPNEEEAMEEELEEEMTSPSPSPSPSTTKIPSTTSQAVVYSKPFVPTPLPTEVVSTTSPPRTTTTNPTQQPTTFSQPYGYEEPFRPIYGPGEGEEEPPISPEVYKPTESRPQPPSIYNLPPKLDIAQINNLNIQQQRPSQRPDSFVQPTLENRPSQPINFNNQPNDNRPSIFNPPPVPIYNQKPGPQRRPPFPPSIRPQPPKYEHTRFQEDEEKGDAEQDEQTHPPTIRTPQIDSQGWKQATFTQTSPPSTGTTRIQFPDDDAGETFTPVPRPSSPSTLRQPLPLGYEPQRPPPPFRPQQGRPRPILDSQAGFRPPNEGINRPNFEGPRPSFERLNRPGMDVPLRHQFENRPVVDGPIRPPPDGQIRPQFDGPHIRPPPAQQQPHRRWETIRPPPNFSHNSPPPQGYHHNDQLDLPNILPQFRPNIKIPYENEKPNYRHPPPHPANRNRQPGGFLEQLQPPPPRPAMNLHNKNSEDSQRFQNGPPLVGRRVGSQVSTLQMMQHGVLPRPSSREDAPHPNPKPPVTPYEVRPSKYGILQQGSEERPVFVVYANSGENQETGDVLVGTYGAQKPLPPSHLTEEEPVLSRRPVKTDFPYALEKPTEEINKIKNTEEIDKDEEINIIPNLQDYVPFAIKSSTIKSQSTNISTSTTPFYKASPDIMATEIRPTIQSIIRPQSNSNEFTVSAVMHTGNHPGGQGAGSVMVVAPQVPSQHRNPAQNPSQTSSTSPESFNFQAPFHASANVAPSPGNGWSAVKGSTATEETLRPGLVDRADIIEEINTPSTTGNSNSKFDIENFKPELIGGFKPLYSFPEESVVSSLDKQQQPQTTEREERKME